MRGLHGGMELIAARDADGRTHLRQQAFRAPVHLSKPHHDAGWLVLNVVSPSPGLMENDRVHCHVVVENGARLLLAAPSASRIHRMQNGHAELRQEFSVHAEAALDFQPEYLIPQGGSRYRQHTKLQVEQGGSLFWTELIAPGRSASGEVFAFDELSLATDLFVGTIHVVRERYDLSHPRIRESLLRKFATPYYANLLCTGPHFSADETALEKIHALQENEIAWIGVSQLAENTTCVKVFAGSSPDLRRKVSQIRTLLHATSTNPAPSLRRITAEPAGV